MLRAALAATVMLTLAAPAAAGEVSVEFQDGYVTLRARDASVREILQEWARVGNTRIVNADRIPGGPVTLELTRVPEAQAIKVLLRSAAGYLAAPRQDAGGPSQLAQIHLMPPSAAPPPMRGGPRTTIRRPPVMQPQMPQVLVDDQGNPVYPPAFDPAQGAGDVQADPALTPPMLEDAVPEDGAQPVPYPGVEGYPGPQPYVPAAGDPPPPVPDENGEPVEEPQIVAPGPMPGGGAVVSPVPGQLPAPNPQERRPRR